MAVTVPSVEYANVIASPRVLNDPNTRTGKVRIASATFTVSGGVVTVGGTAYTLTATDTWQLFKLPKGAKIMRFSEQQSVSGGTNTIAIGIAGSTGLYRAAATHTASAILTIPAATVATAGSGLGGSVLAAETLIIATHAVAIIADGVYQFICEYVMD